ncbi:short-chain dehydrogenase/reductase-like protein SDR [Massariosphaeria phaeospora]|uniref:Short-chain dehydrogenase/reductase-like protein SDR n=1 Tax=Massariosphaeria phaeospora TaxID=100035 RepID=A0A7C8MBT6_9PLEO|nr:short-chain dehydrogenase/reductase-like protein SDR [Massariosphaeria phaeospora]
MPYELKGRNVLVTGGSAGLGAALCRTFAALGCNVAINYCNRSAVAEALRDECVAKGVRAVVVRADMCSTDECRRCVDEAIEGLGGLDIVMANAGWTKFTTFSDLDAMDESEWDRCWSCNVKAPLALLKAAKATFETNAEGGTMITTGSVAAIAQGGSSMAYAVTKAAQLQLVKCLGKTQGPKIRVNSVLPGLLLTEWGLKYPAAELADIKQQSALKHEVFLQDCVDAFVMLARNTSMTGMKVQVDAGKNIQGA